MKVNRMLNNWWLAPRPAWNSLAWKQLPLLGHIRCKNNRQQKRRSRPRTQNGQLSSQIYKFKKFVAFSPILNPNSGAITTGGSFFALNQLPGYTDIQAVFDQYRITKVVIHHTSISQGIVQASTGANGVNVPPTFLICTDYDDSVAPGTLDVIREYQTCQNKPVNKNFSYTIFPQSSTMVYEGVASTGYATKYGQWLSTNDPAVPHYGVKWGINTNALTGAADAFGFTREVEIWFECKNSK